MASAGEEDNILQENSGRRTRSGRNLATTPTVAVPTRATRRSKKQAQLAELEEEHHVDNEVNIEQLLQQEQHHHQQQQQQQNDEEEEQQSSIIMEMLAEAAQGHISDGNVVYEHQHYSNIIQEEVEVEEELVPEPIKEEDVEMYIIPEAEEQNNVEIPLPESAGIDEKSSSFPFGTAVAQSEETSEDDEGGYGGVPNEHHEEIIQTNEEAVESSLLASLAGDNANSLPSVGGNEENELKKSSDDFEARMMSSNNNCNSKSETSDSTSEPAIAEDLADGAADGGAASDATIINTEIISEDELPMPSKPEINDAEEVSDDELPAPQRAELPADAEVISEDEFPAANAAKNGSSKNKRKATNDEDEAEKSNDINDQEVEEHSKQAAETKKSKSSEQYNPMSPTSESCDSPPIEKKPKIDESEHKEKRREKEKEKEKSKERDRERDGHRDRDRERERDRGKDKEKEKDKERHHKDKHREKDKTKEKESKSEKSEKSERDSDKDKDKEKEPEKEHKKLPDLEKYWRAVKEDPADFTGWTYLLQYVDNENDAEAAREAYDAFLSQYPYCYGYWRKYADYEKRKGIKANCNAVFERGLEAIPLSVDLWIHYLSHVKATHADDENYIRSQFERAIAACGLEFRSDKLWDAFIKWENEAKRYDRVVQIYDLLLSIPTQSYSGHFDNFQDLIHQQPLTSTLSPEELCKIRRDIYVARKLNSTSPSSKKSSSKSRREHSKDDSEHRKDEDGGAEARDRSKSPEAAADTNEMQVDDGGVINADAAVDNEEKPEPDFSDFSKLNDEEITLIKDKVISIRRKIHKNTVAEVTARWTFEEGIKRPYFHVKPLERCQLKNWKDYLNFEIATGDLKRILVLFERCLIACALYDEFWLKMIRFLETQFDKPEIPEITRDVYRRACQIHHPDKPSLHLMWAAFEECQNNFDGAADILVKVEQKCTNLLQIAYRRINVERRRGDLVKCRELYEHYIGTAKNKTIAGSLAIKYARFLNKICKDLDGGLEVLKQTLEKDPSNTRVALQMIDLALQREQVDEEEIVGIMDKFMARDSIDPEQKVLFAQRKVEFLEDFGSTAKGLQDAQRALQLALSKANEAKKKRESSPSRKSGGNAKDSSANASAAQGAYNSVGGGSSGTAASSNYNYNAAANSAYYGQQQQQNSGAYQQQQQQQSYDNYYNQWQYGSSGYGYGQWSGYGNYY